MARSGRNDVSSVILDYIIDTCVFQPYYGNLLGALRVAQRHRLPEEYIKELAIRVVTMAITHYAAGYEWIVDEFIVERVKEEYGLVDVDVREAIVRAYEYEIFNYEFVVSFVKDNVICGMRRLKEKYLLTDTELVESVKRAYQSALDENYRGYAEAIKSRYQLPETSGRYLEKLIFIKAGLPSYSNAFSCRIVWECLVGFRKRKEFTLHSCELFKAFSRNPII